MSQPNSLICLIDRLESPVRLTPEEDVNRDEYRRLTELGFFSEGDRLELIEGEIIEMAAKEILHETCLRRMLRELPKLIGEKATWQCQSPIALSDVSEPEPDFAILQNREDDYLNSHPIPGDTLLAIEVSDLTLNYDKDEFGKI